MIGRGGKDLRNAQIVANPASQSGEIVGMHSSWRGNFHETSNDFRKPFDAFAAFYSLKDKVIKRLM